ncbi:MAG: rRNA ((747)-C(5))-methyltransferase [Hydrocarboniphaga sp.]|uniref:23S rRNA (uracil(747)-C(5))-methyltransferase RlmC n=1 Tax=Hydrocarboniphaga sp. TaxID=2033016 RepID=UPI00261B6920|nr:23S rRNA (uracil(747)-C(5))-methyltransferase RlmC [Hydrocarboniphaga sp.]MDB5973062.1 rRNA ((747)-C(5))-methyltransferase [Hydrocarboniphaga sp.]
MQCSHYDAGRCRSCTQLPQPYQQQLAAKQQHCVDLLARHGDLQWLPPVASIESGFRNKAKMVVSGSWRRPVLGILDAAGQGVDLSDCGLYSPGLQSCFSALAEFITLAVISPYNVACKRGELKYLLVTESDVGELMLRFVLRSEEPLGRIRLHLPELMQALPQLKVVSVNLQPEHKAVLEGPTEILLTPDAPQLKMQLNELPLHLRPQSFFQTNTAVAAALYRQARDWVDQLEPASLWDLYCGVGGFALHCASPWRDVVGVETSADAIASAQQSCDELGLKRLQFKTLDAGAFALGSDAPVPELVIVNPPRRGIGAELSRYLNESAVRWLIYSSCNAESLARDLALMPAFKPQQARLLDMFPHTQHFEVIVLLAREPA